MKIIGSISFLALLLFFCGAEDLLDALGLGGFLAVGLVLCLTSLLLGHVPHGRHKKSPLDAGTSNGAGEQAHHENGFSITDFWEVDKGVEP